MKNSTIRYCRILAIAAFILPSVVFAQGDKSKRASPPATATGKFGEATVTINYSSPSVKERKIWGDLVPYGQVWRAGANEATVFSTDKDIKVEGKSLPAGKYSLYAIPGEKEWTIIFNSQTGQWGIKMSGETTEDPAKDVLRVTVIPQKAKSFTEHLTYAIDKNGFALVWENLEVPVSVK
ncbi:MAG: DUF2911 domain-containing protein [Chitinophagaceae bacterium]|jgi:hypothetical protein|nr:DUF2911 domain-containing protein [Chitinophagaceae bacterium]OQY93201.1 MAG: hypothetical protein B6D37_12115 [Sphingobacteriales bacterium UTBCD1]